MMQGDSYGIPIELLDEDGTAITNEDVLNVEVVIGTIKKTYASGDILFTDGQWVVTLSQEDTFGLPSTAVSAQVRLAFRDGSVKGASLGKVHVLESMSKVVL